MRGDEIVNCGVITLGAARTDVADGFVEREVDIRNVRVIERFAIDRDGVIRRNACAECRCAVPYLHSTVLDEIVCLSTRHPELEREVFV